MMPPSRWEQVIPPACMNVASPRSWARSHAARSPAAGWCPSRGRPVPPSRARSSGVARFRRSGSCPPDQPTGPHPPRQGGLRVRQRQIAGDLRGTIGGLAPLPGQRRVRGSQRGNDTAGQKPQVGAQRAACRAGQAGRADGESLDHRGRQQHRRDRVQAERDRVIGELARRPQQSLRPLPAARRHLSHHHRAGGTRRPWRHRHRPPAGNQPAITAPRR